MFSKAAQKSPALQRRVLCEKAPSASQPESISVFMPLVFLVLEHRLQQHFRGQISCK